MGYDKELYKMKILKIILIIILVAGLIFGGYRLYGLFTDWQEKQNNTIEFLKQNQNLTVTKMTELSTVLTRVVNNMAKIQTIPQDNSTYEGLKKEVLELKKNEDENKEKIAKLREELSAQRKAFLASDDRIYIKTVDDETLLFYRDEDDVLQPASDNIEKIIEHRDVSELTEEISVAEEKKKSGIKAGLYYDVIEKNYGGIFSKQLIGIKDYSLNVSLLSDMQNLEGIKFGTDIGYRIGDNVDLGIGVNTSKDIYAKFQYVF